MPFRSWRSSAFRCVRVWLDSTGMRAIGHPATGLESFRDNDERAVRLARIGDAPRSTLANWRQPLLKPSLVTTVAVETASRHNPRIPQFWQLQSGRICQSSKQRDILVEEMRSVNVYTYIHIHTYTCRITLIPVAVHASVSIYL